jgi:hypothetical protein
MQINEVTVRFEIHDFRGECLNYYTVQNNDEESAKRKAIEDATPRIYKEGKIKIIRTEVRCAAIFNPDGNNIIELECNPS